METAMKRIGCIGFPLIALTLCGQAWAGPLEDANPAYQRGDYATAMRLYRPLAEQGNTDAQAAVGVMYEDGQGVSQDYAEAAKWYRLAADQGYGMAQYSLGDMYETGQGVPQDYVQALKWYRLVADKSAGASVMQLDLGRIYANGGPGVPQDYVQALRWYRLAAGNGQPEAQINLGVMYFQGQGVTQDYVQAHKWFNLAASRLLQRRPRSGGKEP
jgi:TPR repeat protein